MINFLLLKYSDRILFTKDGNYFSRYMGACASAIVFVKSGETKRTAQGSKEMKNIQMMILY